MGALLQTAGVLLAATVAVLFRDELRALVSSAPHFPDIPPDAIDGFTFVGSVPRRNWTSFSGSNSEVAAAIAQARYPLVISGSPCTRWSANAKWTSRYFSFGYTDKLKVISQTSSAEFLYWDDSKPLALLDGMRGSGLLRADISSRNITFRQFFKQAGSGEFTYLSSNIDVSPLRRLVAADIEPRDFLRVEEPLAEAARSEVSKRFATNLWIGTEGIVTRQHFDRYHNFYYQVAGHKRFMLAPPRAWDSFGVYPEAHPAARQAHVTSAQASATPALSVVLGPGDLLYLPPYWWHRVEALALSFSVNTWSRSLEGSLLSQLTSLGHPPEIDELSASKKVEREHRKAYLAMFVREVLSAAVDSWKEYDNVEDFIAKAVVHGRYAPLFDQMRCSDDHFASGEKCPLQVDIPQLAKRRDALRADRTSERVMEVVSQLATGGGGGTTSGEEVPFAGDVRGGSGVRDIVLADFVEHLVNNIVGIEESCMFLRCLALAESWEIWSEAK